MTKWILEENIIGFWKRIPYVMVFNSLAEVRKAHIYYMKNSDFKDVKFRIRELKEKQNSEEIYN